jgi:hypothetical protein
MNPVYPLIPDSVRAEANRLAVEGNLRLFVVGGLAAYVTGKSEAVPDDWDFVVTGPADKYAAYEAGVQSSEGRTLTGFDPTRRVWPIPAKTRTRYGGLRLVFPHDRGLPHNRSQTIDMWHEPSLDVYLNKLAKGDGVVVDPVTERAWAGYSGPHVSADRFLRLPKPAFRPVLVRYVAPAGVKQGPFLAEYLESAQAPDGPTNERLHAALEALIEYGQFPPRGPDGFRGFTVELWPEAWASSAFFRYDPRDGRLRDSHDITGWAFWITGPPVEPLIAYRGSEARGLTRRQCRAVAGLLNASAGDQIRAEPLGLNSVRHSVEWRVS